MILHLYGECDVVPGTPSEGDKPNTALHAILQLGGLRRNAIRAVQSEQFETTTLRCRILKVSGLEALTREFQRFYPWRSLLFNLYPNSCISLLLAPHGPRCLKSFLSLCIFDGCPYLFHEGHVLNLNLDFLAICPVILYLSAICPTRRPHGVTTNTSPDIVGLTGAPPPICPSVIE